MTDPQQRANAFRNVLLILTSIDHRELVQAGIDMPLANDFGEDYQAFRRDPFRWFICASDADAAKVWQIIERRQVKNA